MLVLSLVLTGIFPPKVEFLISTDKTDWITFNPIINKKPLSKKSKVNDIQTFSQPVNKLGRLSKLVILLKLQFNLVNEFGRLSKLTISLLLQTNSINEFIY